MVISRGQTCVWAPTNRLISCRVMRKVSSISFKRIPVGMDCRVLFLYHKIVHEAQNVHMLRLDWSVIILPSHSSISIQGKIIQIDIYYIPLKYSYFTPALSASRKSTTMAISPMYPTPYTIQLANLCKNYASMPVIPESANIY